MSTLRKSRILVTGFPSFISLHLIERLKKNGALIFVFKKPSSRGNQREKQLSNSGINVFDVDITNFRSIQSSIKKIQPEIIFHLAAYTNSERSTKIINRCIKINSEGTANLLRALEKTNYKSFVNISSTEVYGPIAVPFEEGQRTQPISPYGLSKLAAENVCSFFYEVHHSPIINLRVSMIYGEFQPTNKIIPHIILSCLKKRDLQLTTSEQTKDFVYVGDVVDALIKASLEEKTIGETINIGTGREITIKNLALTIAEKIKFSGVINFGTIPMKKGEIMRMAVSTTKAETLLDWKPKTTLEKGLEKTISWYAK